MLPYDVKNALSLVKYGYYLALGCRGGVFPPAVTVSRAFVVFREAKRLPYNRNFKHPDKYQFDNRPDCWLNGNSHS